MKAHLTFQLFCLLTAFFLLQGCPESGSGPDDNIENRVLTVDSLSVLENANQTLKLQLHATVPNPCHEFSRTDIVNTSNEVTVNVYSEIDPAIYCIQVLGQLEHVITINLPNSGDYRFRFPGRTATLDTTLTIN